MVADLLADAVAWAVVDRIKLQRARRRLTRDGTVACSLRAPDGEVSGIGAGWLHGRANLQPGRLIFRSDRSRFDNRDLDVMRVDRTHQRRPQGREAWQDMSPDHTVVGLLTPGGVVEWAVLDGLLVQAGQRLTPPSAQSS